ncbi:MAG: thiamine-phosphate pyrophosphorylase [Chlorobi bacterium]|nr:thiamine-phosphate pyrophosphorylase [Chlorobiota bacterium]
MPRRTIGRLHVITCADTRMGRSHAELAELAILGGADTIQYRSKSPDIREMIAEALAVREVCARHGVTFLVNDRVDVALAVDADGVHLGRDDMPIATARRMLGDGRIIGGTVRNREHLMGAFRETADYVGLGPIFGTSSKIVPISPLGLAVVREVATGSPIPVIGIAGIDAGNAGDVIAAGAYGVAVIGAVCRADDVTAAARELRERIRERA